MDDGQPSRQRRLRPALVITAALIVLSIVHLIWPLGEVGVTTFLTATVGAGALAWMSHRRHGGAVRLWLAIGISASALADCISQLYPFVRGVSPDVSIADPPWIASYVAIGIGLLLALHRGADGARADIDGMIDMVVIGVVSLLVIWEFWLSKTVADTSYSMFVRGVWAVYPILDAALLAIVLRAVLERRAQLVSGVVLLGGLLTWLFSDFVWMAITPSGLFSAALDVGWMVGAVLLAVGSWRLPDLEARHASGQEFEPYKPVGPVRIWLAIVPFLVPPAIALATWYSGEPNSPVPRSLATVCFSGLAGARAMRLMRVRDHAQARLASSERLYRALAANSSDAVLLVDGDGRIANDGLAFAAMIGLPGMSLHRRPLLDFVPTTDLESRRIFEELMHTPRVVFAKDTRIPRHGAGDLWLSGRAVNLLDDPDVGAIVFNVHDVTARKQAEEELMHSAFHDSLTGLANRALFRDRVEHALSRRARSGLDPAVIYLDLDGFKNVNDSLGHEAGDKLLREIAARLHDVGRSGDTVARLGGDEFGILIEESLNIAVEAEEIATRALQCLIEPVQLGREEVIVSASLGIAHADPDSSASSLLRDADIAMYEAKATGKARWVVYEPTMRDAAVERLRLETDLTHAIDRAELRLVYQPVVELETGRVVGFEALIRWDHPLLGQVMPDRFIPIAEDSGLIVPIGHWVLDRACATAAAWRATHRVPVTIAVNLSARQLASADLVEQVDRALASAGLDPEALVLEMTESVLIQDAPAVAAKLAELRALGVRLAIDDFGTGYSSLSYLRQFPVDILKIDGSFVKTITDRSKISPIVRGLLDLGRSLDLDMIAEGIESGAQLEQLRDQHCHLGQGFLFAEPVSTDEAEAMLAGSHVKPHRLPASV
jgi:diguanylate cyclase (GGDEF)-like protein/PAS domain S-box-containing protein